MRLKELPECGRIVRSVAGHDAGRYYIVTGHADALHVWLADGVTRKIDRPKKKKLRHLEGCPQVAQDVAAKLFDTQRVTDAELAFALKSFGYTPESGDRPLKF